MKLTITDPAEFIDLLADMVARSEPQVSMPKFLHDTFHFLCNEFTGRTHNSFTLSFDPFHHDDVILYFDLIAQNLALHETRRGSAQMVRFCGWMFAHMMGAPAPQVADYRICVEMLLRALGWKKPPIKIQEIGDTLILRSTPRLSQALGRRVEIAIPRINRD